MGAASCSEPEGSCQLFRARGKLSAVPSQSEAVSCSEAEGSFQLFLARGKPSEVQVNRLTSFFFNIGSCTDLVNVCLFNVCTNVPLINIRYK
jgi:hypothetical protein